MSFYLRTAEQLHEVQGDRLEQLFIGGEHDVFDALQREYRRKGLPPWYLLRLTEVGDSAYAAFMERYNRLTGIRDKILGGMQDPYGDGLTFPVDPASLRVPGRPSSVYWSYEDLNASLYFDARDDMRQQQGVAWRGYFEQHYPFVERLRFVPMGTNGPFGNSFTWNVALRASQPWAYGIEEG